MNYWFCMFPAPGRKPTKAGEENAIVPTLQERAGNTESVNWLFSDRVTVSADLWLAYALLCLYVTSLHVGRGILSICRITGLCFPCRSLVKSYCLFTEIQHYSCMQGGNKAMEKTHQDVYLLERSLIFCLLVCFQRISCSGGELGKCFEQSFSRNKPSIWKTCSDGCWW